MRVIKYGIGAVALTALAAMTGCGTAGPAADSGPATSDAGVAAQEAVDAAATEVTLDAALGEPLSAPVDLEGANIYFIPISLNVAYFANEFAGFDEAMTAAGANVTACDGQFTPTGVTQCIDQAIGAGADAVVTASIPFEMAPTSFIKLSEAGIPTLLAGAAASEGAPDGVQFADADWIQDPAAALTAQSVIADSDGEANVLYLKIVDSTSLTNMADAGLETFESDCPECTVTVEEVSGSAIDQIPSLVSSAVLRDGDIDYVVPQTDALAQGALTGLQNANAANRVRVATATGTLSGLQLVESNEAFIANVGESPHFLGWTVADATVRMLTGAEIPVSYPPMIRVFTKDNVGDLTLDPASEKTNDWYGPSDYTTEFTSLWGLP